MKFSYKIIFFLIIAINFNSCEEDDNNPVNPDLICNNLNSTFSVLYTSIINNENLNSYDTVDSILHAYAFRVSSEKQICSIGYQSFHEDPNVTYDISIKDVSTGILLYSESLLFTQNSMSYITLNDNITLQPDTDYLLSRIQNNVTNGLNNVKGEVIDGSNDTGTVNFLPYTEDELTILNARFSTNNDEIDVFNFLPKIDIIFAE